MSRIGVIALGVSCLVLLGPRSSPGQVGDTPALSATLARAVADAATQLFGDQAPALREAQATLTGLTQRYVAHVFAGTQHGPFDHLILSAAQTWHLDPFLLKGLLHNESKLDPVTVGKRSYRVVAGQKQLVAGGALGVAQFTGAGISAVNQLRTLRQRRGERVVFFDAERALIPEEAIPAAAELLAYLIGRFGRDGGITAYNSGVTRGAIVKQLGFARAQRSRALARHGKTHLQGYRFLPRVLAQTNLLRQRAGLPPVPPPDTARVLLASRINS